MSGKVAHLEGEQSGLWPQHSAKLVALRLHGFRYLRVTHTHTHTHMHACIHTYTYGHTPISSPPSPQALGVADAVRGDGHVSPLPSVQVFGASDLNIWGRGGE